MGIFGRLVGFCSSGYNGFIFLCSVDRMLVGVMLEGPRIWKKYCASF